MEAIKFSRWVCRDGRAQPFEERRRFARICPGHPRLVCELSV